MYTLAIIDIQNEFLDRFISFKKSTERLIKNIKSEIEKAKNDNADILFVEYSGYGKSIKQLLDLTKNYPRTFYVKKSNDDGSTEIKKHILTHKLHVNNIKICGINTEYCVYYTVTGLIRAMKKSHIEIVADACDSPWSHENGIRSFEDLSRRNSRLEITF